jgi:flagellar biosynthesis protein FlhA
MEYTVSSPYLKMIPDNRLSTEKLFSEALFARNDFIFTAVALSLFVGLLLPVPVQLLDVLWVLGLCLSAALFLITISAKEAGELSSFPLLLVVASVLRIALTVASARLISAHAGRSSKLSAKALQQSAARPGRL